MALTLVARRLSPGASSFLTASGSYTALPSTTGGGNANRSMVGSIEAFSGPELDWVVQSWWGNPAAGFTNHHLTIWMPPTSRVPHLGMAIGTIGVGMG